jgi:hypothetical protein
MESIVYNTNSWIKSRSFENNEIIDRLNDRFDILQKKNTTHLFFYGAGCGTDKMKISLSQIFQNYFPNAIISVEEDTYAAVYANTKKDNKP